MSWRKAIFTEVVNDITGGNRKFQTSEYQKEGLNPIVDQSENFISGYTNIDSLVKRNKDVVIFGDHTKVLKYIDFDFCLGADGVKVLEPIKELDSKYLYFFLKTLKLPDVGYSRHFKFLKEIQIPLPPLDTQKRIAQILDAADALKRKDQELLQKYDQLAQAIFIDMFGDPVKNEKGWEVKTLASMLDLDAKGVDPKTLEGYNYIGLEHIEKETGKILNVENGQVVSNKFLFTKDHILYGKLRPYLNKVATPNFSGICSTDIFPLKPKVMLYKQFLVSILRSNDFVNHSNTNAVGANLPRANKDIILGYKTIFPNAKLAELFSNNIELVELQKKTIDQQIIKSENLFQTLLQKAFKGELVS